VPAGAVAADGVAAGAVAAVVAAVVAPGGGGVAGAKLNVGIKEIRCDARATGSGCARSTGGRGANRISMHPGYQTFADFVASAA
jgi:hypothetical protein